jgi:hypothetical protein
VATALLLIAENRFSETDSVFVKIEYDDVGLAASAIVIDNEFGHTIVCTVTGPANQVFTRTFSTPGLAQRIPVAGFNLAMRTSPKGVNYIWLPLGWSVRTDVT